MADLKKANPQRRKTTGPRARTRSNAATANRAAAKASSKRTSPARRRTPRLRAILIHGDKVAAATRLIAETLPLAGYTSVLADCPGKRRPSIIRGMRADHRPNVVCQGGLRYVLMDVLFPGEMQFPEIASRWQLFSSAAEQAGGEFHVIVPRWVDGVGPGREAVAKAAEALGIRVAHVWEI